MTTIGRHLPLLLRAVCLGHHVADVEAACARRRALELAAATSVSIAPPRESARALRAVVRVSARLFTEIVFTEIVFTRGQRTHDTPPQSATGGPMGRPRV